MATTATRSPAKKAPAKRPARKATPAKTPAADLKLSPEVLWYLESRGIPLPDCPPKFKTPEPRNVRGAVFDPGRVDRVLAAYRQLRHTQGQWAGQPLMPDPWQIAYIIAPVFGWVRYDAAAEGHVRIISSLYAEVPRKNGKTTLFGGLGLYMTAADGEQGAQVLTAATTEKQAGYLFNPVKQLAEKSPGLKPHVKALAKKIVHPKTNSYFEVVSSVAEALHGGNIHCGLVDELHVHKSPDLVETIESGTGSRRQPLVGIITTADDSRQGTIYARKREWIEKLSRGVLKDPTTYGVVWCADETDDPFVEATWKKANPGYGISPTRAYLVRASNKAQQSPADLSTFLRLHLGLRTKQQTKYIDLNVWRRNGSAGQIDEEQLHGLQAYGGLDLASTSDLCALSWTFPMEDGTYQVLWRHWCPEAAFEKLNARTAREAEVWQRDGWLEVTPGDVADYDYIHEQINRDREAFNVVAIGFDRWNSSQLITNLLGDAAPMVSVGQGYRSMSPPLKQIKHLLLSGTKDAPQYQHGNNPLMLWQVDNLAVAQDAAGNVKPDKERSGDKIDGFSAATNAMAMAMTAEPERRSAYEDDRGLEVV
jgi:phage terminase large subunit-like protein